MSALPLADASHGELRIRLGLMALWRGHGNFPSINLRECSLAAEPTFALCAILKDESDYIEEWLAFHILQGVSRVILYDNNSSDDTCERAWSFAKSIDIQVISWPDSARGFDRTQRRAYVDGARRLSGAADYVAFIDLDEFLFASDYGPLGQTLAAFPTKIAAVAVNQRIFGSSGQKSSTGDLVTSRFTMTAAADYPEGHFFKTIARPDRIIRFDSVHSVVLTSGTYVLSDGCPLPPRPDHPGFSSLITDGALRLHHYMLKSRQEFERKRQRWAGQDLSNRLTDEYFSERDRSVNAVRDERLTVFAERIRELIGRARGGAR